MKSERRHELKTNTLAHGIEGLPELWRRYGGKVLLGLVAVLAVILFFRMQARNAREREEQAGEAYASALTAIGNLQSIPRIPDAHAASDQRQQIREQADRAVQQVLDDSKNDVLKAQAWVARGDLNWNLARLPEVRGADTQPSLKLQESTEELLEKAQRAYGNAADASGAKPVTVTIARMGLAAVAEQRRKWDEAKTVYEKIDTDPATPDAFRVEAKARLEDLVRIQKPVLIGKPATEPAVPGVAELPVEPAGPPMPTTGATTTTGTTTGRSGAGSATTGASPTTSSSATTGAVHSTTKPGASATPSTSTAPAKQ